MTRTLVVLRDGPAVERSWLGLRTALALGLAGDAVTVALLGDAVALAATPGGSGGAPWLGGDPQRDLAGLVDDLDATVIVDATALASSGVAADALRSGCIAADEAEYSRRVLESDWILAL